jgi:hypothetical protein
MDEPYTCRHCGAAMTRTGLVGRPRTSCEACQVARGARTVRPAPPESTSAPTAPDAMDQRP